MTSSSNIKKYGVHPLVIASCCDHYVRDKMCGTVLETAAIGFIFGHNLNSSGISISDAVDAVYTVKEDGSISLDESIAERKKKLWIEVDPTIELLGWYAFGRETNLHHMEIHKSMMNLCVAPIFLLLDPEPSPDMRTLPLHIFDAKLHIVDDAPCYIFVEVEFLLVSSQSERIAVDQVVKSSPSDGATTMESQSSVMVASLQNLTSSIKSMYSKVCQVGQNTEDLRPCFLRAIHKLCNQFDAVDSRGFQNRHDSVIANASLVTSLAAMTSLVNANHDAAVKMTTVHKPL